jgi:hypothetical protein
MATGRAQGTAPTKNAFLCGAKYKLPLNLKTFFYRDEGDKGDENLKPKRFRVIPKKIMSCFGRYPLHPLYPLYPC